MVDNHGIKLAIINNPGKGVKAIAKITGATRGTVEHIKNTLMPASNRLGKKTNITKYYEKWLSQKTKCQSIKDYCKEHEIPYRRYRWVKNEIGLDLSVCEALTIAKGN